MKRLKAHLTPTFISRLTPTILVELGVAIEDANALVNKFGCKDAFDDSKSEMLTLLDRLMPDRETHPALKKLFRHRNKVVAHEEKLDSILSEQLKFVPSLGDMHDLNKWAGDFSRFALCVLTPNETIIDSCISARMAALNVAAKLLGKTFDDPSKSFAANAADRSAFFTRRL